VSSFRLAFLFCSCIPLVVGEASTPPMTSRSPWRHECGCTSEGHR